MDPRTRAAKVYTLIAEARAAFLHNTSGIKPNAVILHPFDRGALSISNAPEIRSALQEDLKDGQLYLFGMLLVPSTIMEPQKYLVSFMDPQELKKYTNIKP